MSWLKAALGVVASAYVKDAVVKPKQMGAAARAYCDRVRKPLLLVRGDALLHRILGEPVRAEAVTTRAYPVMAAPKTFGAVFVVGVLERLERPDRAMTEWHRVADKVFVVVPSWWSPHTWLDPRHRWFIDPSLKIVAPLWTAVDGTRLLVVSDSGYGSPRCSPSSPTSPIPSSVPIPSMEETPVVAPQQLPPDTDPLQFVMNQPSESEPMDPYAETSDLPLSSSSGAPPFALGNGLSGSWNSVSTLTVVSTPGSSES